MDITEILKIVGPLSGLGIFLWKLIDRKFDKIDKKFEKMDDRFTEIKNDILEVKERLTYLEACVTYYNLTPDQNSRREGAKKMWERRRQKNTIKHDKDE